MNTSVDADKWIIWAIADINSDIILGSISIWNFNTESKKAELGFGLFPGNKGKGLITVNNNLG